MKNLIDRYVFDVVRRLPEGERGDVERELRANIRDMLPEDSQEAETVRVLESLGDPRKLAEQYRINPRYLISPAMFEQYVAAVRIILPIVAVGMGLMGLLIGLAEGTIVTVADAIQSAIGNGVSAAISALFTTTLGFALADYYRCKGTPEKWSPKDLPDVPSKEAVRISRGETITGMIFSAVLIAFAFAVMRNPQLLGWYERSRAAVPLFTPQALARFVPWFIFASLMSLGVSCYKLIVGRWNYPLAVANTAYNLVSAIIFLLFLMGPDTFNAAIADRIAEILSISQQQLARLGQIGLIATGAMVVIFSVLDIGSGWRKARKGRGAI